MSLISRLSLRWKLVLTSLIVQIAILALLVSNGIRLLDTALLKQAEVRLQEISVLLNAALGPNLAAQDYAPIADVFSQSRARDGIEYFVLQDKQGKVLINDGWPVNLPLPSASSLADIQPEDARFDTRIPISLAGQRYGDLSFGVSTRFISEGRRHLIRQSLLIALGTLILSSILLSTITLWLTRHLQRLRQASQAVGQGKPGVTVDIPSQDEIGQLAHAFNVMSQHLDEQLIALRNSESRFRSLLALSTDYYWEQDRNFRFTAHRAGKTGQLATKDNPAWLTGKCRWELDSTLTPEQWAEHKATLESHQIIRDFEYGIHLPNGVTRYYRIHGEPLFDEKGIFTGYRGTATDITGSKQAEVSLQLAASVFAEAHEGIVITDAEWRIVDLNPMACELTRQSRNAMLGTHLGSIFSGCDGNGLFTPTIIDSIEKRGHWQGEAYGLRQDTSVFPIMLTISAVDSERTTVENHVLIFSDITSLKEQQARLEALAHYDSLTGLPNRVLFADRLRLGLTQAARNDELLAVAYLDLDGFKPVNDTLGHDAGDELLVEVSHRLRSTMRGGDTVARLGGDEFALLMRAEDFGECEAALLRVLSSLSCEYHIKSTPISISASIGVTVYPRDTADPDLLLRHADQAMYIAKQAGRNRYHFFDAQLDNELRYRHEQQSRIGFALEKNQFQLHYQPKVNMTTGEVIGAEALIRWNDPEYGLRHPGDFLPFIENTDLIVDLGNKVISQALAQMSSWQKTGLTLPISINIAPRQLQAPNFASNLHQQLLNFPNLNPAWVELEIVETTALTDIQYVSHVLEQCLDIGVKIALDDFGTGYSSLTYLRQLPIQTLKIDRSFVHNMLNDPSDKAIVDGVIGLARSFKREVIAEGVESAEHGDALIGMGCFLAQGYGIARPMSALEIPNWIGAYTPPSSWKELSCPNQTQHLS